MAQKLGNISYTFHLYHFLVIHFFIMHREYLTTYNSLNFMGLFLLCVITAALFQWLLTVIIHGVLYIKQGISYNQD
ncbi:hypothetical protein BMR04_05730 [Methylococcaceae bacterium HT3]|nr:hypothetical protein BMR04_05730 [Methylococcaceae bacterium HT3]